MSRFCMCLSDLVETVLVTPAASIVVDINNGSSKSRSARVIVSYATDQAVVTDYTYGNDVAGTDGGTAQITSGTVADPVRSQIFDFNASTGGRYVGLTFPVAPTAIIVEYYNHDVNNGFGGLITQTDGTKVFASC